MTPTNVANQALAQIGNRTQINAFTDGSAAANAANLFYATVVQGLLRAANWDFARKQIAATQIKAAVINGQTSSDPPPQPWQYEYLYPSDCLKMRFMIPYRTPNPAGTPLTTGVTNLAQPAYANTKIPFVVANDPDARGNPRRVVLTNLPLALFVYTADLSQYPDMWDPLFLSGVTATLGSYFINTLARDQAQMNAQIAIAKGVLDAARTSNGNEGMPNINIVPDWLQIRASSGGVCGWSNGPGGMYPAQWDACAFPGGLFY